MANPRQKKKARSSILKVRRKPKSQKARLAPLRSNAIIAANWDNSETLAQNYKRLGLTRRLNKSTGGVEKKVSDVGVDSVGDGLEIGGTGKTKHLDVGEAKIERDPRDGRILRILDDGSELVKANPLNDPLNDLDSDSDDAEEETFNQHGHSSAARRTDAKTEVVAALEKEASRPEKKFKRRQPEGEKAFVAELVAKYGDDYEAMQRDVKINYMQRSAGDLKRRVKKWREEGGSVDG